LILDARRDPLPLEAGRGQFLGIFPEPRLDEQCVTLPADSLLVMSPTA
jgi:hypothetical protein